MHGRRLAPQERLPVSMNACGVSSGPERLARLRDTLSERLTPLPDGRLGLPTDRYPMATQPVTERVVGRDPHLAT